MAQFVDAVKIQVQSGAGGNGMVAWRREKYEPHGGPAGGDGGKGGSVYLEATEDLSTLLDFKYQSIYKADPGENGRSKNQHGRSGKDLIVNVPCGTVVRDAETGDAIADLTEPGQRVLVAQGGRGGRGNSRFVSSRRQAPHFSEPGEPGIVRELELELKLIADVGLIGMPNAGKSTLISVISAAKPKIADYPFTTLTPNLGVVRNETGDSMVVADIPGLIEGASEGVGLGHEFLRHIERTRLLLHLVDIASGGDPLGDYRTIRQELARYSEKLAGKPELVVLTKIDALTPEAVNEWRGVFKRETGSPDILAISAVARQNIDDLLRSVFDRLPAIPPEESPVEVVADEKATDNDDSAFEVRRKNHVFYVSGGKVERFVGITDMKNRASVHHLMDVLRAMGVFSALAKAGAEEGMTVCIAGAEFEYYPEE